MGRVKGAEKEAYGGINFLTLCGCESKFLKLIDQERNINIIYRYKGHLWGPVLFPEKLDRWNMPCVSHNSFAMNVV